MAELAHVYPEILTNKNWQKNKGAMAKLKGETGVGAQLDECEKAWKSIKNESINPDVSLYGPKAIDPDLLAQAARSQTPQLTKTREELRKLVELAKKVEAEFKESKVVSKDSEAHIGKIGTVAGDFATALKLDQLFQLCEEAKKALVAARAHAQGRVTASGLIQQLVERATQLKNAVEKNVPAGAAKLGDSEQAIAQIKRIEDEAMAPTGPIVLNRLGLDKTAAPVFNKLGAPVRDPVKKLAQDELTHGMRLWVQFLKVKGEAATLLAKQKLTAEKAALSGKKDAQSAQTHLSALQKEIEGYNEIPFKAYGKLKNFANLKGLAMPLKWLAYDLRKQELFDSFAVIASLPAYYAVLEERVKLAPDADENVKKLKAQVLSTLTTKIKEANETSSKLAEFEKLCQECDKLPRDE